jgi:hypothetical protein
MHALVQYRNAGNSYPRATAVRALQCKCQGRVCSNAKMQTSSNLCANSCPNSCGKHVPTHVANMYQLMWQTNIPTHVANMCQLMWQTNIPTQLLYVLCSSTRIEISQGQVSTLLRYVIQWNTCKIRICISYKYDVWPGLAKTIHTRCIYGIFGRVPQIYGHIRCIYTVLSNPAYDPSLEKGNDCWWHEEGSGELVMQRLLLLKCPLSAWVMLCWGCGDRINTLKWRTVSG